jgi:hypothetical protein
MKTIRKSWAIWAAGALLLAACSSGGGGGTTPTSANKLTLTTTDGTGATATITADDTNAIVTTHVSDADGKTLVQICADVDKDNDCSHLVIMTIDGTTAQTYPMDDTDPLNNNQIVYHDDETESGILSHYLGTKGQIVLSEVGAPGAQVKGTFTTTLACNSGCAGNLTLAGEFDFKRTE